MDPIAARINQGGILEKPGLAFSLGRMRAITENALAKSRVWVEKRLPKPRI
jgi:hypothetical protein